MRSSILKMFAQHMDKVSEAVMADNWQQAEQYQMEISRLEQEADTLKRDIRLHLPKGLFLPVARSDIINRAIF